MIPQEPDEQRQREEPVPSPGKEQHAPRLASWWRNRALVLNIFCIVDPTHPNWPVIRLRLFGCLVLLQLSYVGVASRGAGLPSSVWLLALFMGLSACVGAFLLRSWWALLVAPVVVVMGTVLPGQFKLDMFLITVALPAFLGAVLGSVLVKHRDVRGREKGVSF